MRNVGLDSFQDLCVFRFVLILIISLLKLIYAENMGFFWPIWDMGFLLAVCQCC
jgi:hypothetical protein